MAETELRDPDIVAFIQGQAEVIADLQTEVDQLEAAGSQKARRRAKSLRGLIGEAQAKIAKARDIEVRRDALVGEGRDALIRAKLRGEEVEVREVERASFALNEHGGRIINRAGPNRGLPVLVYERGVSIRTLTGIEHAFARGYLGHARTGAGGEALLQIGHAYAEAVVKSDPLKAVDPTQTGGGGFGPRGPQAAACEAAEWLEVARERLSSRQRIALDEICGAGKTVPQLRAERSWGFNATVRALRGGLAQVAASLHHAKGAGSMVVGRRLAMAKRMGI
ncbi:hypothetical protein [Phenylobacterium conjunctum]|uniref:Uncharacterized protein n=1 Tax=Phenylobacterium conjunctum TaxID=1298959 RepID=A0ABW3SYN3_9CAUL